MVRAAIVPRSLAARIIVRIMPVQLRVIEKQLYTLPMAFVREHSQGISPIRGPLDDVPIRYFGIEHCKSVMVPGGYRDVLHARRFRQRYPGFCVKLFGVKEIWEEVVLLHCQDRKSTRLNSSHVR